MRAPSLLCLLLAAAAPATGRAGEIDLSAADADELYRCKKYPDDARIRVTLKPETSVTDLVTWGMGFTCKSFVLGQAATQRRQTVTVIAPAEMSPRDAYRLFLLALHQLQLTVVPRGRVYEIVDQVKLKDAPFRLGAPAREEETARVLVRPTHLTVEEAAPVLEALKSQFGVVTPLAAAGVILVTDQGVTIARMREVLAEVDRPRHGESVWILRLRHADAKEVAATLGELRRKVIVDARANALLFSGTEAAWAETLRLAQALDVELEGGAGRTHVRRLAHARAEEVQKTLAAAAAGPDTKVLADPASNTLVVVAPNQDWLGLREVLAALDRPRRQVYVEATILEVTVNKGRKLGAAFHAPVPGGPSGAVTVVGAQHAELGTTSKEAVQGALVGAAAALFSTREIDFLGISIPSFGALVHALQTDEEINVLSAPQLMAVDGREAEMNVGANVPVPTSLSATTTQNPFVPALDVRREKVGLTLKLKPFVGDDGQIQLDIEQTSNELGEPDPSGHGPTWEERSLKTSVVVRDGQPIVIGGLMIDRVGVSRSKVPLLGDLPLLGALFRWEQETKRKRNLLVILTPTIVDDPADAQRIFEHKLREREEFARAFSSLRGRDLEPAVDYRRKRGLVAEIDARVAAAEREAEETRRAEAPDPAGSVVRIQP